ncbi:hypothetical protein N786_00460 [Bacillus amyloliquefaciens UASWS BA1]|nr:hypothetical protein N786_00460 [Bacillus amyloliquefaciens UASWS BA1]
MKHDILNVLFQGRFFYAFFQKPYKELNAGHNRTL